MSSWFSSASAIDELIDKATSENLPAGTEDLALNLEICDQIRSKQVPPKDATRALKRRISHKNPNVQLLALGLTDVCVKNGGQHFLVEVASRDFIDNLTSNLKAPGVNPEVRRKILALIQTWGKLFITKRGLGYVPDTYQILKNEGYEFPPADNVGAALVETEAPPDWTDSDVCTRCRVAFTLTNRKHHCRACGSTFCGQCSSRNMALPELGVTQEVRVCDGCWTKRKLGQKNTVNKDPYTGLGSGTSTSAPSATSNSAAATASTEDDDIKRAIELSLKEANSRPGYTDSSIRQSTQTTQNAASHGTEEEDADLLAAIEASLRDANISEQASVPKKQDQSTSNYTAYTYSTQTEPTTITSAQTDGLSATDRENIEMFSTLVERIQTMNGDVAGNRELQVLYEQIAKLQSKVTASLEAAAQRQQEVMQANGKIDHAVRIYDHLLQERLNSTYQRRMNANNYGHPEPMQHSSALGSDYTSQGYPQHGGNDGRYAPYTPDARFTQQQIVPPFPTSTQPNYQLSLPTATAPFVPSSGYVAPTGVDCNGATPYAPPQDSYYASAPDPSTAPVLSTLSYHHQDYSAQAYTSAPPANLMDSANQGSYAPYSSQQQPFQDYGQRGVSVVSSAPVVVATSTAPAAPIVPVEEKPLIEF